MLRSSSPTHGTIPERRHKGFDFVTSGKLGDLVDREARTANAKNVPLAMLDTALMFVSATN